MARRLIDCALMTLDVADRKRSDRGSSSAAIDERGHLIDDIIAQYLAGIGNYELLDKEDEINLARAIEAGRKAKRVLAKADSLTAGEMVQLQNTVAKGQEAKEEFITSNLRLVVATARRYYTRSGGIDFADLIQEGNLGLLRAVDKFDWRAGYKFSTYATNWIRAFISRVIAEGSDPIRIPIHIHQMRNAIAAAQQELATLLNRDPTLDELADEAGIPLGQVELVKRLFRTESLNHPVGQDGAELGDFIPDDEPEHDAVIEALSISSAVMKALSLLPEREARILICRHGLTGRDPMTLEEIGELLNLTRERVRQLEKGAYTRLRHPSVDLGARVLAIH
jgi:RNA polymerase sigma factor (sigma-70 family)